MEQIFEVAGKTTQWNLEESKRRFVSEKEYLKAEIINLGNEFLFGGGMHQTNV